MSNSSVPVEQSESQRLEIGYGSGGTRRVRFRMGASWVVGIFLAIWLCGWAFGEVMVAGQLLSNKASLFSLVWLVAWTVGGLAAGGFLLWMLFGEEVIEANAARLHHAYRIFGLNRVRAFDPGQIANLRYFEQAMRRSTSTALSFDYGTRTIKVFHAINSAEAAKVIEVVEEALGRRRDR